MPSPSLPVRPLEPSRTVPACEQFGREDVWETSVRLPVDDKRECTSTLVTFHGDDVEG